jgi:cytosine/adenosine deaminase-related metal-dependent hydrolase
VEFWRAEAQLAQLERLKAGVTTGLTLLGGGADVYRTDDPTFGDAHSEATRESGLRTILAVGPGRHPFPQRFRRFDGDRSQKFDLSFARQLAVSEALIRRWNDVRERRAGICLIMPVYSAADMAEPEARAEIEAMSREVAELRAAHGVLFTQDGHRNGSIALARDLGLLGPFALLSHSVDLTPEDITALKETGAHVVHNPSAIMSVFGRCPAPELIGEGVTVCIGSDAGAPDRGFDMFRHMAQCMHYHRRHFRDPAYMPPGKVLEMVTIDAARALGLDDVLGSLETGKKADIVLVDIRKPHLYPPNMPVTRLAHFANAADVDTVIVDGAVLLRGRRPVAVDEQEILDAATTELALALERTGLQALTMEPPDYWGTNRRLTDR